MVINNGYTLQAFTSSVTNLNQYITFPIAFNSTNYNVFVTDRNTGDMDDVTLSPRSFCEWYDYRTTTRTAIGCTNTTSSTAFFVIGS